MGKSPRTVGPDSLATAAAEMLRDTQVDQLPVVDGEGRPVGLLDVQDLLRRTCSDEAGGWRNGLH